MSFLSMPHGLIRNKNKKRANEDTGFTPNTMIDVLFDYKHFLVTNENKHGSIAKAGPSSPKKVAIIGAGASGLVAAYELSKVENIQVSVFEASDRIGGRMDSIMIPDGALNQKVFEMGCMRFPPTSHTLYYYLNKFKLKPVPNFPDPGVVNTQLLYQNEAISWPAGNSTPDNPDFQRIGNDFSNMLQFILGDADQPNYKNPEKLFDFWALYQSSPTAKNKQSLVNAWQLIINQYSNVSYFDAVYTLAQDTNIVTRPWDQEDMNKFGALGVGSGGFGPLYNVNFVEILRLFANGWEDNQELLLTGIGSLVDSFNMALNDNQVTMRLNKKITKIEKQNDQYLMTFNQLGGVKESEHFDSIIIATTTRAMEYMGLTVEGINQTQAPLLRQPVKESIRNLHLMNSSKFFVTTKTKFWYAKNNPTNQDLPFNIQTDELMRGLYCLNYDADIAPGCPNTDGKGVVLISYVWGDDSSKLLGLSEAERFQQFLLAIKEVNPTFAELLAQQVEKIQMIDWESEANYYGAFKLNYPGQEQDNHAAYFQYQTQEHGVFLAGDSVSWAGGWLEGAMPSGINAACAAAAHVGAELADGSPLTEIPIDMYRYNVAPNNPSNQSILETISIDLSKQVSKKDEACEM